MARVRVQQGCCARAHRDVLTASLGTLAQWPSLPIELIQNSLWGKNGTELNNDAHAEICRL
jgi:hypothetical protein